MSTEYPNDQFLSYASANQMPKKPTSITVLSIIGIIIGVFGVTCTPASLLPYFVKIGPPNPAIGAMRNDRAMFAYTIVMSILGFLFEALLLCCSIAALMLKEWGRKGLMIYSWWKMLVTLLGFIVSFAWIFPKMTATMTGVPGGMFFAYGGAILGGVISLAFPICVLIFMQKQDVKAAFAVPEHYQ